MTGPWLQKGLIRSHRTKVCEGGLDGILGGLEMLKNGKVSGEKLVYVVGKE